jgi:hypothetical protein
MQSEMVVCPWNEFLQHYSPWTPSETDVQQGVSALQKANILNENGWVGNMDPTAGPNENVGFKSLEDIALKLEHVEITDRQASYRLMHRPTRVALSTISSGNHMVDGCFYPIKGLPRGSKAASALEMRLTASVHEYKLKNDPKGVHDVSLSYLWLHVVANLILSRIV